MKKSIKIPVIILSVVLIPVLLMSAVLGAIYLYSEIIIFDHRDISEAHAFGRDPDEGTAVRYLINYPFFANPISLSGGDGRGYSLAVWGGGEKNIEVYESVNAPVFTWVDYLYSRYLGRVNLNYTLEQDSKTISVSMSGNVNDGEKDIPVEQKFVFNVENADPDNPPEWINQDEISDGYREFWDYVNDPWNVSKPDWLSEQIASS